jgi:hypothetical protein
MSCVSEDNAGEITKLYQAADGMQGKHFDRSAKPPTKLTGSRSKSEAPAGGCEGFGSQEPHTGGWGAEVWLS